MKLTVTCTEIASAIDMAMSCVKGRTTLPAIQCLRLDAEEGSLTVCGTDLDNTIWVRTEQVNIEVPGSVLIPADRLRQIVKATQAKTISISTESDVAVVQTEGKFKVNTLPVKSWPDTIGKIDGDCLYTFSGDTLNRMLTQATAIVSRKFDAVKGYNFTGVSLDPGDAVGRPIAIATDSSGMIASSGDATSSEDAHRLLLSRQSCMTICRFASGDDPVSVVVKDSLVMVSNERVSYRFATLEGDFPDWRKYVPKDFTLKTDFDVHSLSDSLKRARITTSEDMNGVVLDMKHLDSSVTSSAAEAGEFSEPLSAAIDPGVSLRLAFPPDTLLDVLAACSTDEISAEFTSDMRPVLIRAGEDFFAVVMPKKMPEAATA